MRIILQERMNIYHFMKLSDSMNLISVSSRTSTCDEFDNAIERICAISRRLDKLSLDEDSDFDISIAVDVIVTLYRVCIPLTIATRKSCMICSYAHVPTFRRKKTSDDINRLSPNGLEKSFLQVAARLCSKVMFMFFFRCLKPTLKQTSHCTFYALKNSAQGSRCRRHSRHGVLQWSEILHPKRRRFQRDC
jgi:hypothetical protein